MKKNYFTPLYKPRNTTGFYQRYVKRPMDVLLSFAAIVLLVPIFIIVAVMIKINLGSPVLFKQKRPGLDGKIFLMYKFRSMNDKRDEKGDLLPDSERLTRFGRTLRATSLDELPELINILKGDMSIVGPRPLLVGYLDLYDANQRRRHEVRPGLSGLAQVNGRNALNWDEKFYLDIKYVDNVSFIGDWKIIFRTIKNVIAKEGINSDKSNTMEPFCGNRNS